jgi:hypothetical protein
MRLRLFLPITLILMTLSAFNCKSSTEPDEKKNTPPDSTSQNFTFEIKRFGSQKQTSVFKDVWLFDENNIWAVGDVLLDDPSVPNYGLEYNILQWNGKEWKGRGEMFSSSGIYSIWALDTGRVYFTPGAPITYKYGQYIYADYSNIVVKPGQSINRIWAGSEDNVWGVGAWGALVHFDGKAWKALDFDTQWYFYSITGSKTTGVAYALALNTQYQTRIVKLQNSAAEVIYTSESQNTEFNGWTLTLANEKELFIGNGPIWKFNVETKAKQVIFYPSPTTGFVSSYAVSPVDVYFYGFNDNSDVLVHYNGKRFKEFALPGRSASPGGIKATSNIAAAVSLAGNQAQIITIKRR